MQSARFFLQSSELGLPHSPSHAGECAPPPPLVPGEGHTHFRERGWGEFKFRRGDIQYIVVLYLYMYFVGWTSSQSPSILAAVNYICLSKSKYAQDTTKVEGKSAKRRNLLPIRAKKKN
jgi:hypothetical protein